jgi:hypothetical protein
LEPFFVGKGICGTFLGTIAGRPTITMRLIKWKNGNRSIKGALMFFSSDYESRKEHYKDLLRDAEKERLISRIISGDKKLKVWQSIVGLLARSNR